MCSELRTASAIVLTLLILSGVSGPWAAASELAPLGGHGVELGVYTGRWDFHGDLRLQDDTVLGVRAGLEMLSWLQLETEVDFIAARDRLIAAEVDVTSFAVHGRLAPWSSRTLSPALLIGVAFMGFDLRDAPDAISEGFDLGLRVSWELAPRLGLQAEVLQRLQSVQSGDSGTTDPQTRYLWNRGLRIGLAWGL